MRNEFDWIENGKGPFKNKMKKNEKRTVENVFVIDITACWMLFLFRVREFGFRYIFSDAIWPSRLFILKKNQ